MSKPATCFISYSRDSKKHCEWIERLAHDLHSRGIYTILDKWDLHPGGDFIKFMEASVRESDSVIIACSSHYKQKADARTGGVGYETALVSAEIFTEIEDIEKFVPILCSETVEESVPTYMRSLLYVDFSDPNNYEESVDILLRKLHGVPKCKRPPLGLSPYQGDSIEDDHESNTKSSMLGRNAFTEELNKLMLHESELLSIIFIDADDMNAINMTHGVSVGDEVIERLSMNIWENSPKSSVPIHWGGDEFLIILPNISSEKALIVAEYIRKHVEIDKELRGCTISLGISSSQDWPKEELKNKAYDAVGKAKGYDNGNSNGKNQAYIQRNDSNNNA